MTNKFLLLLMGIFLMSSCTIDELIERREDRLIGSWEIDRARFDDFGFSFSENIISEYRGDILTFYRDGSLEYRDNTGEIYNGTWYIDALRGGEEGTEYTLDADFYDIDGFLAFRWLGEITRLTYRNFNINIADRDGELRLRWDKK